MRLSSVVALCTSGCDRPEGRGPTSSPWWSPVSLEVSPVPFRGSFRDVSQRACRRLVLAGHRRSAAAHGGPAPRRAPARSPPLRQARAHPQEQTGIRLVVLVVLVGPASARLLLCHPRPALAPRRSRPSRRRLRPRHRSLDRTCSPPSRWYPTRPGPRGSTGCTTAGCRGAPPRARPDDRRVPKSSRAPVTPDMFESPDPTRPRSYAIVHARGPAAGEPLCRSRGNGRGEGGRG